MSHSHHFIFPLSDWWGTTLSMEGIFFLCMSPRAERSVSLYNIKSKLGSVPVIFDTCLFTHGTTSEAKTSSWFAGQLFGQATDSVHQLRLDKRVFILAIAAVLSALPLHILVVFSDKSGHSALGLRGLPAQGSSVKEKDWWWSELRERERDKCWRWGRRFVRLGVRCWTFAEAVRSVLSVQTCAVMLI